MSMDNIKPKDVSPYLLVIQPNQKPRTKHVLLTLKMLVAVLKLASC